MKRERLYEWLESRWRELHGAFEGLSDDVLLEGGVVGPWSVRDVLAHVTTWDEEALKALPVIVEGGRVPRYSTLYGGIDAFNEEAQGKKLGLSLGQVFAEMEETHQSLMSYLDGVPDAAFATEGRFLRRLRQDTYGHYREHAEQVRAWREKRCA